MDVVGSSMDGVPRKPGEAHKQDVVPRKRAEARKQDVVPRTPGAAHMYM